MPPSQPTRSVAVGSSVITVGVPGGTLIMGGGPAETADPRKLEEALAQKEPERRTIGELTEASVMTASEATDRVEEAAELFSDALAGKLVDLAHAGQVLDVLEYLDKNKRYEEWLRYARSVHGVLVLLKRWMDLLRLLRTLVRSSDEVHEAGLAWAQHELGTLHLAAGDSAKAAHLLERARATRQELGDAEGLAATEHGLGVVCRRHAQAGLRPGRLAVVAAIGVLLLLAAAVAGAAVDPFGSDSEPLSVLVEGAGVVTAPAAAIRCTDRCDAELDPGTRVTLTAAARRGSTFEGWSGDCRGSRRCRLSMDGARTVTARFERTAQAVAVTVDTDGDGAGRVRGTAGIDCPGSCETSIDRGREVVLEAIPDGSTFAGWSGAGCGETSPCRFIAQETVNVTARFTADTVPPDQFVLSVTRDGQGSGSVTSDREGIECPDDCEEPYDAGTDVELFPEAEEGSVFAGWSGVDCPGTDACLVPMTQAQAVTARFEPEEPVTSIPTQR